MLKKNYILQALVFVAGISTVSCTRKWDDHNKITDIDNTRNLYQKIADDTSLTRFTDYLKRTGYADTLQLSKSFTVWAPVNDALTTIDATIGNDVEKLEKFVAHHIARLSYSTLDLPASKRIQMLDGKYVTINMQAFDTAPLNAKDQAVANGILHTITAAVAPAGNCWDYIDSLTTSSNMAAYLKNLQYDYFDSSKAVQTGIDPQTGLPVYEPGTGIVSRNTFIDKVYNLTDEAKEYTVFVLNNTTWESERAKLDSFYKATTPDSTLDLAYWNTAKDLVIEGAYSQDKLPDSVLSKFGVWVPINKQAIAASYRTSNGYVHVMNEMNVPLHHKIMPFVIQGENPAGTSHDVSRALLYRTLINPNTGQEFKDLFVYNHGINRFHVRYRIHNVYTTKYKVYWVAYNNRFNNTLNQRLAMGSAANATFAYKAVSYDSYQEEFIGEYTVDTYGKGYLDLYLVSANITPTSSNQNSNCMFLDYIRLEPVL